MNHLKKLLPLLLVVIATVALSLSLSTFILKNEKERCWEELQGSTETLQASLTTKFQDEIVKLHLIETVMLSGDDLKLSDIDFSNLDTVDSFSVFNRIDILFPDNTFISGGVKRSVSNVSFEEVVNGGERMSKRRIDFLSGTESIYYIVPIVKNDLTIAVLLGVIDLTKFHDSFNPTIYGSQGFACIVDSSDGNYIADSWHKELGNIYEYEDRERLKDYKNVNLRDEMINHKTGAIAFKSRSTGKDIYMYYTPLGMFNWQLAVFAPKSVLFENYLSAQKVLTYAMIAQIVLLGLYFWWNVTAVKKLEKSNSEIQKQKELLKNMSYKDGLTQLFNRRKYIEDLTAFDGQTLQNVGVIYIDLNDLKVINDSNMHDAGDEYLRCAADAMSKVFGENSYRIGGDEFVIIEKGVKEADFWTKAEKLKVETESNKVGLSAGKVWCESCNDLPELLGRAEKLMYKEKEDYHNKKKN